MKKFIIICLLSVVMGAATTAQQPEQMVRVIVAPDHGNWQYKVGERVRYRITVLKYGNPVKNVKLNYEIGPEKLEPGITDSAEVKDGTVSIDGGSMKQPGFLRCIVYATVDGKKYRNLATVAFEPEKITATTVMPSDFLDFWGNAKKELAKMPVDAKMTLLPERCSANVNVYQVNLQNLDVGMRVYGILCMPKKAGRYPALLKVPGGGVRGYQGDIATAEKGIITFEIGIHGIPVDLDPEVYLNLQSGALKMYQYYLLENQNRYYYKKVYMGCLRANDFLASLPEYDGTNLGVLGGSQGGALAIVTAALDPRVKYLASYYPALCDLTAYLQGRAGGWPHIFDKDNIRLNNSPEKINTCGYYDVVNFARQLKVEGHYAWGFNDEVCPPSSIYAAYNTIVAPKARFLSLDSGHWVYPEVHTDMGGWLVSKLLSNSKSKL